MPARPWPPPSGLARERPLERPLNKTGWQPPPAMLYCYIISVRSSSTGSYDASPSWRRAASLAGPRTVPRLRLSAVKRLALAGALIALIWAAALWATS